MSISTRYPFTAVVGMDDLRLALVLSAVSPAVGGVLVRGEKGTAKSTMVRALAGLLPDVDVVSGCRFSCDPVTPDPDCPDGPHPPPVSAARRPARLVELPVGATEDRVLGSLHLERALAHGETVYEPGLLAGAHRGVLYVDEVNLLADHLVDVLLDAAAMGRSTVEREGVSASHAARFVLVGTMNPEEGELRPQLLDRFGLTVQVAASRDAASRVEVVRRRLTYEADPAAFAQRWADDETELAARIARAQRLVADVVLTDAALRQVAEVCAAFGVDGLRADLVTARAAVAHAAWHGRRVVETEDVRAAARLALPHRARRDPFDPPGLDEQRLEDALDAGAPQPPDDDPDDDPTPPDPGPDGGNGADPSPTDEVGAPSDALPDGAGAPSDEPSGAGDPRAKQRAHAEAGEPYRARLLTVSGSGVGVSGRRGRAITSTGRTVGARRPDAGEGGRPHLLATLSTAAPHQRARGRTGPGLLVHRSDLRLPVREGREGNLVLLAVDASGSMAARQRLREVKTAVLSLLLDAYQRRDKVGLVTFRGTGAELVLPPTSSVEAAAARLRHLTAGGRTPLAEGLLRAADVVRVEQLKDATRRPLLVVVTDGRATAGPDAVRRSRAAAQLIRERGIATVVIDCEATGFGTVSLGLARQLADDLAAEYLALPDLAAGSLTQVVRDRQSHGKVA
ncbi:putative cobaltochelatase [Angustibacter luteus]|uniref:Mg-protoporphyrin IX chelatase n=1 Tax=Angustibacter luteus TaxID=658456 RepID=A0ABW1JC47_9ACTN